ncbi:response regulator [Azonexus sp. IMCC34839]|uniref:response regulator n=1 Tax=Azonexus sp. IMCC34839 TaxID=3133695 RepID=UPI00399B92DE
MSLRNPGFANSLVLRISLLLLLALGAFTIGLYLLLGRPTVQRLAESQMQLAADQLESRLEGMLHGVEVTIRSSQGWGMDNRLDHAELLRFNEYYFPVLANHDQISSVIFAHESGREILLLLGRDGRWINRITNPDAWGNKTYWITWNAQREIESVEMRERDYDARKRPWFIGAMALPDSNSIHWTEPYIFYTTLEAGITAAMRWQGKDGSTYVIGHDVKLIDLAEHTSRLSVGIEGKAALLLKDGKLLAPPRDIRYAGKQGIKEAVLKTPEELGMSEMAQGLRLWRESRDQSPQLQAFTQSDGEWFSLFKPLEGSAKQVMIGIVAPKRDFVPITSQDVGVLMLIAISALALGIAVALRIAHRFGAPLDELAAASDRIGHLELIEPVVTSAPWLEVKRLAGTLERMRQHLLQAQQKLRRVNLDLEEKVAARTEALRQNQDILQKREAFFRAIFDNAAVGIVSFNAEQKPILVNRAYADFTGYPIDVLLANPEAQTVAPEERKRLEKALQDIASGQRSFLRSEFEFLDPQGHPRFGDVQIAGVRNERNELDSILVTVLDVTDRREVEIELVRQFSFMQALIDTIPNPIFYKGADTRFLGCNQAYEDFFGIRRSEFVGKRVLDLEYLPQEARIAYQAEDERVIAECGRVMREVQLPSADGSLRDTLYSVTGFRAPDGEPGGLIGVIVDISAQKQAERDAEEARGIAEKAAAAKADFLANMSHEIRTPMNAIIGMTHLALQTELSARQRNYLGKVDNAARGLLEIINDILDFSKIEAGMMRIEKIPFSLDAKLRHLADLCSMKACERGLELVFDVAPEVPDNLIGDPLRLGQILLNLVGNGIKFTEHGEVTVRVRCLNQTPDLAELRFEVNDSGIGMSEQQQADLFKAFSQADTSTTRKYGGTGLGLSISKRLVELLGGNISVRSEIGVGSSFIFELPFALADASPIVRERMGLPKQLQTLVVDDSPGAREVLCHMLASLGFECLCAASGAEALERLREAKAANSPFGLLIVDWKMPGMDGIELLRYVGSQIAPEPWPAIIMTSAYDQEELEMALGDQTDLIGAILAKPATASSLFDAIMTALHRERHGNQKPSLQNSTIEALPSGKLVLLVEDNEVNRELAEEMLINFGLQVESASNGKEALELVGKKQYDLVLMDCHMPVMDGYEATRRIRGDLNMDNLPVIAMTANAMAGDRERCLAAGMNDHIAKPIDIALLQQTLLHWLNGRGLTPLSPVPSSETSNTHGDIDTQAALARLGGNQQSLDRLMLRFGENQGDIIERLRMAQQADNRQEMILLTHTLRGLAGNIGGTAVARAAGEIETALKNEVPLDSGALQELLRKLEAPLANLLKMANEAAQPVTVPDNIKLEDRESLYKTLSQLQSLLDNDDATAVRCFNEIYPALLALCEPEKLQELRGRIERYDFEEASASLTAFIETLKN